MYVLEGGPRDGELVDELPEGYVRGEKPTDHIEIFDGYTALRSVWIHVDESHLWPWLADHLQSTDPSPD